MSRSEVKRVRGLSRPITMAVIAIAIGLLLFTAGIYVGYRLGQEGDGKKYTLLHGGIVEVNDQPTFGRLPPGATIYGVRDPFGDKTNLYKAYFTEYVAHPVPMKPAEPGPHATAWLRPIEARPEVGDQRRTNEAQPTAPK